MTDTSYGAGLSEEQWMQMIRNLKKCSCERCAKEIEFAEKKYEKIFGKKNKDNK